MGRAVAAIERGHGAFHQFRHQFDRRRKLARHRGERRRKRRQQADLAAPRDGLLDHRLVGLEHRHRRVRARNRFDAGAEGGAGEQDRVRSGAGRIAAESEEALGHGLGEPAVARQIGRQAVVEQVHQAGVGPKPREGGLDRHNRMFQGVDQGDAHAEQSGCGAAGVNPPRRSALLERLSRIPLATPSPGFRTRHRSSAWRRTAVDFGSIIDLSRGSAITLALILSRCARDL